MKRPRLPKRNFHHFVFAPKYRRAVLGDALVRRVVEFHIRHICELKNIEIIALNIQPDHVHLLVSLPKSMTQTYAVFIIKWYSSIWTRKQCTWLKDIVHLDHLWQRGYWVTSVGGGVKSVRKYVKNQ